MARGMCSWGICVTGGACMAEDMHDWGACVAGGMHGWVAYITCMPPVWLASTRYASYWNAISCTNINITSMHSSRTDRRE